MAEDLGTGVRARISIGDFGSWMASEQRRVFLICRRMLQDRDEADAATQDVFFKAFCAVQKGDAEELESPGKWVVRIAVNTCLDRLRSKAWKIWQRRPTRQDEELILERTEEAAPDAEAQLFAKQIQVRLEKALEKLSSRQRAVFTLRHYDALALDEIAEVLRLDVGTVKAHLFRALAKLREELRDLYNYTARK